LLVYHCVVDHSDIEFISRQLQTADEIHYSSGLRYVQKVNVIEAYSDVAERLIQFAEYHREKFFQ